MEIVFGEDRSIARELRENQFSYTHLPIVLARRGLFFHVYPNGDMVGYDPYGEGGGHVCACTDSFMLYLYPGRGRVVFGIFNDKEHDVNYNVNNAIVEFNLLVPCLLLHALGRKRKIPVEVSKKIAIFFSECTDGKNLSMEIVFHRKKATVKLSGDGFKRGEELNGADNLGDRTVLRGRATARLEMVY